MYFRKLNKKAQEGEGPPGDWFVFIIVLLFAIPVVMLLFMGIIGSSVAYKTRVPYELEEYILINKFLSSGECFAYYDSLAGDYIPLSVDLKRFSNETLKDCYQIKNPNYYAVRLTLHKSENEQLEIITENWNHEMGAQKRLKPQFVTLYDKGSKTTTRIIFELQNVKK